MAFNIDILAAARENTNFRAVLATGPNTQIVVMSIPPGGEIGAETHEHLDQVLTFVDGEGLATLGGEESAVSAGHIVLVPAGTHHNFVNTGAADLRLYTVYAPPQHTPGTVHRTKADADADETDHYTPA
jgi:mannose-6-phosphate isomerase-like protein (cupin superfamily)